MHVFLFLFTAYAFNFVFYVDVILFAVFTALQLSGSYCMHFPRHICVCLLIFWGCWSDAAECFCSGMCCDYFAHLFGVVFLCNCLFSNDFGAGF